MSVYCYSISRPERVYPSPPTRRDVAHRRPPPFRSAKEQRKRIDRACRALSRTHRAFERPLYFCDGDASAWTDFGRRPAGRELLGRFRDGDVLMIASFQDVFFSIRDLEGFWKRLAGRRCLVGVAGFWTDQPGDLEQLLLIDSRSRDFGLVARLVGELRRVDRAVRENANFRGQGLVPRLPSRTNPKQRVPTSPPGDTPPDPGPSRRDHETPRPTEPPTLDQRNFTKQKP